jgi:pentatricopeptide repeat protein
MSRSLVSQLSGPADELSHGSMSSSEAPYLRRQSLNPSDVTIDKLNYASLGLHGREKEVELLKEALGKLRPGELPEQERQLVLISGYSGTGKTSLAVSALKKATEKLGGLFVRGKFDLNLRNEPYSGINLACSEICGAILQLRIHKPSEFDQLCSRIKTDLGSELDLLMHVIPILAEVVEIEYNFEHFQGPAVISSGGSRNQFNFVFLRFIRAISHQFSPLIIVLDDLQWADGVSLDLLDALLTDPMNSKLMVVGVYRSNEVDATHIFHHAIQEMATKSKDKSFGMTQLEIGNLGLEAVHGIIKAVLGMDSDPRTLGLADVCYKKTHGNVFFLLQYLSMLKIRQVLEFDDETASWIWEDQEIESKTTSTENVVDLLKSKMVELPKCAIEILNLTSCLGASFEMRTLKILWERSTEVTPNENEALMSTVTALEVDGYFKKNTRNSAHLTYSWSHDKIQEAALTLIPEANRGAFAANVGRILLTQMDEKDLDASLFVVVNLLNEGDDKLVGDENARLNLARLNYRASRKAILFSAFESAARYAAKGIQLLPETAWTYHYDLSRSLHTTGAQAEGFMGKTETMQRYCNQVLLQKDRPMEDKLGVYNTWIDSLLNQGSMDEARDLSLEILRKFKCRFPKCHAIVGLALISNIVRIKATMKSRDAATLDILTDTTKIELMRLLDKLATIFYLAKDDRMPLAIFRSLNWTMKFGFCEYSSVAFATTGMMLTGVLNDLQGGSKYGEQALALMERSRSQATTSRTMFIVYAFLFPWTKPIETLLKPLLRSYDLGMQAGYVYVAAV